MQRTYICYDKEDVKLFGYNVGKYPLHHFTFKPANHQQCLQHLPENGDTSSVQPAIDFPVQMEFTGEDEWIAGCHRHRVNSDVFSVEYVLEGEFLFRQHGKKYICTPGQAFLIHLNEESEITCQCEYAKKRTMILSGPSLNNMLVLLGLKDVDVITIADGTRILDIFLQAYDICLKNTQDSYRDISMLAYRMLLELEANHHLKTLPSSLIAVTKYILTHLNENLAILELAKNCGISQPTLFRLFERHLKVRPSRYISDLRLSRACTLLKAKLYSIKEIAQMTGFSTSQYFASEFKRKYGVSPRDYDK